MDLINQWLTAFNAFSIRLRVLSFAVLLAAVTYLWYVTLMAPLSAQKMTLQNEVANRRGQIANLTKQISAVRNGAKGGPAAERRSRIASLKFDIDKLDERLKEMTGGLIDPTQMAKVLQGILTRSTGLTLVSVESLDSKPLIDKDKQQSSQEVAQVYMHGVRIRFKGGYMDTLRYLKAIEKMPWRLFWGHFDYDVKDYPEAYGTLVVYTLSMKEGWIGV